MMFFYFFKNHCLDQRIKTIQNIPKKLIYSKKKKLNFGGTRFAPRSQTLSNQPSQVTKRQSRKKNNKQAVCT